MLNQARVVVIGGGAMGVSLLYHLTKLGWRDVALVRVADGKTIEVQPDSGVDLVALRAALLGPAFTVLLLQRGQLARERLGRFSVE